jgi:hypothetical protein
LDILMKCSAEVRKEIDRRREEEKEKERKRRK